MALESRHVVAVPSLVHLARGVLVGLALRPVCWVGLAAQVGDPVVSVVESISNRCFSVAESMMLVGLGL